MTDELASDSVDEKRIRRTEEKEEKDGVRVSGGVTSLTPPPPHYLCQRTTVDQFYVH